MPVHVCRCIQLNLKEGPDSSHRPHRCPRFEPRYRRNGSSSVPSLDYLASARPSRLINSICCLPGHIQAHAVRDRGRPPRPREYSQGQKTQQQPQKYCRFRKWRSKTEQGQNRAPTEPRSSSSSRGTGSRRWGSQGTRQS